MSADNYVVIADTEKGFMVTEGNFGDASLNLIGIFNTKKEAEEAATAFCQENIVEYGVRFLSKR